MLEQCEPLRTWKQRRLSGLKAALQGAVWSTACPQSLGCTFPWSASGMTVTTSTTPWTFSKACASTCLVGSGRCWTMWLPRNCVQMLHLDRLVLRLRGQLQQSNLVTELAGLENKWSC